MASREDSRTVSSTVIAASARPFQPTKTVVPAWVAACARSASSTCSKRAALPTVTSVSRIRPEAPSPGLVEKSRTRGSVICASSAPATMARAIGCSLPCSTAAAAVRAAFFDSEPRTAMLRSRRSPVVTVPGLVEHDRVDPAGVLEDLRALDEGAELRTPAGADEQGGGGGQAERARAGDDEHRHGDGEGPGEVVAGREPGDEGDERDDEHDGDEDRGHAVGEALDVGLAGLGALDEPLDAGEHRVGADLAGLDDEASGRVDRAARHLGAGRDVDRGRLAGDEAGVDGARPVEHGAVGRDLLAGSDDEVVADDELLDGDPGLGRDPAARVDPQHGHVLGAEVEQRPSGRPCRSPSRAPRGSAR